MPVTKRDDEQHERLTGTPRCAVDDENHALLTETATKSRPTSAAAAPTIATQ